MHSRTWQAVLCAPAYNGAGLWRCYKQPLLSTLLTLEALTCLVAVVRAESRDLMIPASCLLGAALWAANQEAKPVHRVAAHVFTILAWLCRLSVSLRSSC